MKRIFVDTSGMFAALVPKDAHHSHALKVIQDAQTKGWILQTSQPIVYETHALLLNRSSGGRRAGLAFLESIAADSFSVERPRSSDEERALQIIRSYEDKEFSFCDAVSFAMIERLGLREALSFDRHFREFGRLTLL